MAGIYIHIPFCKSKCIYCDFCSFTNLNLITDYLKALQQEILIRKDELNDEFIDTIYFGGGTPSLLLVSDIQNIIEVVRNNYKVSANLEITYEVNPDDITFDYLKHLLKLGINRISIGIQSFNNHVLTFLKRRHNAYQAEQTLINALNAGFKNISCDLIFGIPNTKISDIINDLDILIKYNVQHISAYHLTYEKGTELYKLLASKKINLIDEEFSLQQFSFIEKHLLLNDYNHYEISNYSLQGFESKHNSNYWNSIPYIGFGLSAHSYNKNIRSWNSTNLNTYISSISIGKIPSKHEKLTSKMQYNEFIMTSLRTSKGIDIETLKNNFEKKYSDLFLKSIKKYIDLSYIKKLKNNYVLTSNGMFLSDGIIADLFVE